MPLKYIVTGRASSGKTTLAQMLGRRGLSAEACDVIVTEPTDVTRTCEGMPDVIFHLIYVRTGEDVRRKRHESRDDDTTAFDDREAAEKAAFDAFERDVLHMDSPDNPDTPRNVTYVTIVPNDGTEVDLDEEAERIARIWHLHRRMSTILQAGMAASAADPDDRLSVMVHDEQGTHEVSVPVDEYVDYLLTDNDAYATVMQSVLSDPTMPEVIL